MKSTTISGKIYKLPTNAHEFLQVFNTYAEAKEYRRFLQFNGIKSKFTHRDQLYLVRDEYAFIYGEMEVK